FCVGRFRHHALHHQVMSIRIRTSIDNSARLAMTYSRQLHELLFRGRIYIYKMMPAAVPAFAHSLSSCLRLIRGLRSGFTDFTPRLFERWLGTLRGFRYLVPCALLTGPLIGARAVVVATDQTN